MGLKLVNQPNGVQILRQGKTPGSQQTGGIDQVQMPHASVVVMAKVQPASISPVLPMGLLAGATKNALVGHHDKATQEIQMGIKVNLQRCQNVLLRVKL
jgi:hypothetical protein